MRRLPHRATLHRPSRVIDAYDDEVDGPLEPQGDPVPAWLQVITSTEATSGDGSPVVTRTVLYFRPGTLPLDEDDVVEVDGKRYTVDGEPRTPVNPSGRSRFASADLVRVTRGGN